MVHIVTTKELIREICDVNDNIHTHSSDYLLQPHSLVTVQYNIKSQLQHPSAQNHNMR